MNGRSTADPGILPQIMLREVVEPGDLGWLPHPVQFQRLPHNPLHALLAGTRPGLQVGLRTQITWQDPMIGAGRAAVMPGIDYLQGMIDGEIPPPPIIALMDMDLVSVGPGTVTFTA